MRFVSRMIVPGLVLWLSFWGLITALSQVTGLGLPGGLSEYPEVLLRAPHFLAPLALLFLFSATYRSTSCPLPRPEEKTPLSE